jgi:flagellar hook-associated protein 3 FlgL
MTSIPSNLSRVPNLLSAQMLLGGLNRTNVDLFNVQNQIATGRRVSRFSDDAIAASTISVLQDRLGRSDQTLQNLRSADNTLNVLDTALKEAQDLILEAKSIASDQINANSDSTTRENQAVVIDGMLRSLFQLANTKTNGLYVFGGSTATQQPLEELRGGYRYVGRGGGLIADLDSANDVPITVGNNAIGQISARHLAGANLSPALTGDTRLSDVSGARGLGIRLGTVSMIFDGGPALEVDLAGADTAQDVADKLTLAIRQYESDNSTTILGPGGVAVGPNGLTFDVTSGSPAPVLTFSDVGTGTTAADLGLAGINFSASTPAGGNIRPKLTLLTPLSALPGVTTPLEGIRIRFSNSTTSQAIDIDLSSAQTVDDVRSIIETAAPGVRVQVNKAGSGLDILSEIAGPSLSVEEIPGGAPTAAQLGLRTFGLATAITEFNNGRGISIVDGKVNAVTGLADREVNRDFRITLGNGQAFDVDLRPQDMVDVQSVINRINEEFTDAIGQPPLIASAPALAAGQFTASINDGTNGISLTQTTGGAALRVTMLNNSQASTQLGLTDGSWDGASATLVAQDRTGVRVNNLFTALIDLRDALRGNDPAGITVAGEDLEANVDRLSSTRALVGVYANRVTRATERAEDAQVLDEKLRSGLQDTDYADASIRFNLLRTQLQAALQSGAQLQNLSLLNFIG